MGHGGKKEGKEKGVSKSNSFGCGAFEEVGMSDWCHGKLGSL